MREPPKERMNERESFWAQVRNYLGDKTEQLRNFWHPSPEEIKKREKELLEALESMAGFIRRDCGEYKRSEYPLVEYSDLIDSIKKLQRQGKTICLQELDSLEHQGIVGGYEKPVPMSRKRKFLQALISIPPALYAAGLPSFLQAKLEERQDSYDWHSWLNSPASQMDEEEHPSLDSNNGTLVSDELLQSVELNLQIRTQGCQIKTFSPQGELLKVLEPKGPLLTIKNLPGADLLQASCPAGEQALLHAAVLDLEEGQKMLELLAWAGWLQRQASADQRSPSWHKYIGLEEAHQQFTTGDKAVKVVVIDMFLQEHPELENIQCMQADGSACAPLQGDPEETKKIEQHGMEMTGLIAAQESGVAPDVTTAFIQLDNEVPQKEEIGKKLAQGIELAVDQGANVISISIGRSEWSQPDYVQLKPVIEKAQQAGVIVMVYTGNQVTYLELEKSEERFLSTDERIVPPEHALAVLAREYPHVFLIHATSAEQALSGGGSRASFSPPSEMMGVIGTSVSVLHNPFTREKVSLLEVKATDFYQEKDGTSCAVAIGAGVVGLMLSVNPELRYHPDQVLKILNASEEMNNGYGVNAYLAVKMAVALERAGIDVAEPLDIALLQKSLSLEQKRQYQQMGRRFLHEKNFGADTRFLKKQDYFIGLKKNPYLGEDKWSINRLMVLFVREPQLKSIYLEIMKWNQLENSAKVNFVEKMINLIQKVKELASESGQEYCYDDYRFVLAQAVANNNLLSLELRDKLQDLLTDS